MMEAVFTSVMRADFIEAERASAKSDELRLVQWPMTLVIPVNRASGLISGEIMYAGAPLNVEPCDRAMTLDRKSVVQGKSVTVREELGGRRTHQKKTKITKEQTN